VAQIQARAGVTLRSQPSENRLEFIDFLRGVAIVEMLTTHYAVYLPLIAAKVIDYTETAMALFVLLAGFLVGWGWRKFERDPSGQTWVVWKRALRVLAIQYLIILTLSVPLHLLGMPAVGTGQSLAVFVWRSMAFMNQIGLIDILPTFIPLFVVSPAILFALAKGWDAILLLVSLGLFGLGHFHPHLLDLGEPTIFPFILFQLYFVIGCLLGKRTRLTGSSPPQQPRRWLVASGALLLTTMLLFHGKVIPSHLLSTHPLNLFGLVYHAPIIATVWLLSLVYLPNLQRLWLYSYVTRFGRHALLAFVIHVYLAEALAMLNYFMPPPPSVNYLLILASVFVMNEIVRRYERSQAIEPAPVWSRAIHSLFK
jgi:hypothetical protein